MKTGIFYWFGYRLPTRERFELIASAGFDNVLLWWGDQFADFEGQKETLPGMARKAGLFVENIHADFENANALWTDEANSSELFTRYMNSVEACRVHEIPAMVVHLTEGKNPPPPSAFGLERMARLVEKAEQCGVDIALENVRTVEHLEYVFSRIDSVRLKLCYDSGHENCWTRHVDVLGRFGGKLAALHINDNDGSGDQHMIPGRGIIDTAELAGKLKRLNFNGSITLEVYNDFPAEYKNLLPEDFLFRAHRAAAEIAARVGEPVLQK